MKRAALLLAGIIALGLLGMSLVQGEPGPERSWLASATTYSPGPRGSKALFLLLGQIELDVERLRHPGYSQLLPETVLWVLAREPFGRAERRDLLSFLRKGGTLVAPPESLAVILEEAQLGKPELKDQAMPLVATWGMSLDVEGAPESIAGVIDPVETYATTEKGVPIVAAWKIGEGRAVSIGLDQISKNSWIGRSGNGPFLARLALTLGKKHVFDENKTGFGEGDLVTLLVRAPYRWGVAQLVLVGIVGLVAFARRRLPAEPPENIRRRRTLDHVEAVARLWEQAKDAGLPLRAIMHLVAERARIRLGGAGGEKPFIEWIERVRPKLASRASDVWGKAERICCDLRPSTEDACRAAEEIKELEQEGLKW